MSNVLDLSENLVDKVLELGVSGEFLAHPAFIPALREVSSLISQMNISKPDRILVNDNNGKISFEYESSLGDKYSFELNASSDEIRCVRAENAHSFVGNDGEVIRQKHATEVISKLDGEKVTIISNFGAVNNIGCIDNKHYNLSSSIERRVYDKDGVMYERESKYYAPRKGEGYLHRVGVDELLSFARWVPQYSTWDNSYSSRTLLRREMLDVASIVYEDRPNGEEYIGKVPLNQDHGLRDMFIANGYNVFPVPRVKIYPLMDSEIDRMISREYDDRVANGLKKYAVGRNTYSYDSGEQRSSFRPRKV